MSISPLLPCFSADAYRVGEIADMTVMLARIAPAPIDGYLVDLSPLRKLLVVGAGGGAWLSANGLPDPRLMQRIAAADGRWVARIGALQVLVGSGLACDLAERTVLTSASANRTVLHYDAVELAFGGVSATPILAELCALDLTQFPTDAWIATLFAGVEVGLYRDDAKAPHYRLVCAGAEALFLFETLAEMTREFGGAVIGYTEYLNAMEQRGRVQ